MPNEKRFVYACCESFDAIHVVEIHRAVIAKETAKQVRISEGSNRAFRWASIMAPSSVHRTPEAAQDDFVKTRRRNRLDNLRLAELAKTQIEFVQSGGAKRMWED